MKHNHNLFVDMARRVAKESTATRLQVGAIIAKNGSIIECGYNGTAPGADNSCETVESCDVFNEDHGVILKNHGWVVAGDKAIKLTTKPEVVHAEMNCLMKCAKLGKSVQGAILYITHAPCGDCAKHVIASGISEVIYIEDYRSTAGIDILTKNKIKVTKWHTNTTTQ
jgi:dCMP deaminase